MIEDEAWQLCDGYPNTAPLAPNILDRKGILDPVWVPVS